MLAATQLAEFAHHGYLVVPGVLNADACAKATTHIDDLLRERPPAAGHTGHHFYFEEAQTEPLLMGMLTQTPAWQYAQQLVAPAELQARPQVQVALTFPPHDHRPGRGHIDGITPPEDD